MFYDGLPGFFMPTVYYASTSTFFEKKQEREIFRDRFWQNRRKSRRFFPILEGDMNNTIHFTKKEIDAIPFSSDGQSFYRDEALPGFGLRVGQRKKTFILEKRIGGKPKRLTIGDYGPLSLEQGKKKALEFMGMIAQGKDVEDIYRPKGPTFRDLVEAYQTRHLPRKKSGFKDQQNIDRFLKPWNDLRLTGIKRKDVALLHAKVGQKSGPYSANRVLALVRTMFNLGTVWGF